MGRNVVAVFLVVLFILAVLDDHSGQCMPTQRTQTEASCKAKCTYLEAYRQADCEDRKLSEVPTECNAASYLSLRHNQIERIEPGTFESFSELQVLILSNNRIRQIEADTFSGAPILKSIKLLFNNLTSIDRFALNGTGANLQSIYLSRNKINHISEGTFQWAPGIGFIDLYNNSLGYLSSGVFSNLTVLQRLFLGKNKLETLPSDIFRDLRSLTYLDLSDNSLYFIDDDLFANLVSLRTADLSGNQLVSVGGALHLPKITGLDFRKNNLTGLGGNVTIEILMRFELLYLENNPWFCGCEMEPYRLWYLEQSKFENRHVYVDKPVCSKPSDLHHLKIGSVDTSFCLDPVLIRLDSESLKTTSKPSHEASTADDKLVSSALGALNTSITESHTDRSEIPIAVLVVIALLIITTIVGCFIAYKHQKTRKYVLRALRTVTPNLDRIRRIFSPNSKACAPSSKPNTELGQSPEMKTKETDRLTSGVLSSSERADEGEKNEESQSFLHSVESQTRSYAEGDCGKLTPNAGRLLSPNSRADASSSKRNTELGQPPPTTAKLTANKPAKSTSPETPTILMKKKLTFTSSQEELEDGASDTEAQPPPTHYQQWNSFII